MGAWGAGAGAWQGDGAGGQRVPGCQELGLSGSLEQAGVALGTSLGRIPSPSCSLDTAGDVKSIGARE